MDVETKQIGLTLDELVRRVNLLWATVDRNSTVIDNIDRTAVGSCDKVPGLTTKPRSFGWALKQMRKGRAVTRAGWDNEVLILCNEWLWVDFASGRKICYVAPSNDLLATDWQLVE